MRKTSLIALALIFLGCSSVALAQSDISYVSIVDLPIPSAAGSVDSNNMTTQDFIRILYALSITIAAVLAVVKIIYGGVQYMLSDVVTSKEQAKKDIWGALLGLVIVLSAVLILNTINPQLNNLNILQNVQGTGIRSNWQPSLAPANNTPKKVESANSFEPNQEMEIETNALTSQARTWCRNQGGNPLVKCKYDNTTWSSTFGSIFLCSEGYVMKCDK